MTFFSPTSTRKEMVLGISKFSVSIWDEYLALWAMALVFTGTLLLKIAITALTKTGLGPLCYRLYQRTIYTHILKDLFHRSIHSKYAWLQLQFFQSVKGSKTLPNSVIYQGNYALK